MINLLKAIFGYCPKHGWFHRQRTFKMNYSYMVESNTWLYGCKQCANEADYYWEGAWEAIR